MKACGLCPIINHLNGFGDVVGGHNYDGDLSMVQDVVRDGAYEGSSDLIQPSRAHYDHLYTEFFNLRDNALAGLLVLHGDVLEIQLSTSA